MTYRKIHDYDRALEVHWREQDVVIGLWRVQEKRRIAWDAASSLNRTLEEPGKARLADYELGELGRELEQQKRDLEDAGGLDRMLEQHRTALKAASELGRALEQYQETLEAVGGLERVIQENKIAMTVAREFNGITIEPGKRSGQPCLRGIRMTVYDVLEYLASGMSEAEILDDFPNLTQEDLKVCRAFADALEQRLQVLPAQ